ncbi:MAG: putative ABC transporter permease [Bacilli bacterium]
MEIANGIVKISNDKKNNLKKTIKTFFLFFMIGSIVGWIYEVIFYLIQDHQFYNRGFLYGPYLPIYGYGTVLMILFLKKFKNNIFILFIMAVLISGILEYATGMIMWQIWHQKWWDYTGLFLNIDGFVCLRSVVSFGIAGTFLISVVEPFLMKIYNNFQGNIINLLFYGLSIVFLIDNIITFIFRHPI